MTVAELTQKFQKMCVEIGYTQVLKAKAQRQIAEADRREMRLVREAVKVDDSIPAARLAEQEEAENRAAVGMAKKDGDL